MKTMNVYLDNAATTKVSDEAIDAMMYILRTEYGNPSSTHYMGRRASEALSGARKSIADALSAAQNEIYFTSGGTEANNWAILGLAEAFAKRKNRHMITTAIEHNSVHSPVQKIESMGWDVTYLMPDKSGRISPADFGAALREDTAFASIMLVNNETGAINPIHEFAAEIKRRTLNTVLHTDAVQGFCKIPFAVKTLDVDLLTISAHKIHGSKGAGALYVKSGVKLPSFLLGGPHENEKRAGTEALPAAVAFGEAARLGFARREEVAAIVSGLREHIVRRLSAEVPDAVVIGAEGGSPFILNLSLPGHKSEVLMSFLESDGICVSKSSACKKGARSHVLTAMQLPNTVIDGAIRVSFSRYNTPDECEYFVQTLKKASQTLFKAL